jgi:hypothetical protein
LQNLHRPLLAPAPSAPVPAYNCSICYNPATRERFWGFATVLVAARSFADKGANSRLQQLGDIYDYKLFAPFANGSDYLIARSPRVPRDTVSAAVAVPVRDPALRWRLELAPADGWCPGWRWPMVAVVVLASALFGLLSSVVLASRRRLIRLVGRLQVRAGRGRGPRGRAVGGQARQRARLTDPAPSALSCPTRRQKTNTELAQEKERMDVLLARQLNLITCALGQRGGAAAGGGDPSSGSGPRRLSGGSRGTEEARGKPGGRRLGHARVVASGNCSS